MNYLDIIIAIPLAWGAYKGFKKGLIISVASLIALLFGIYGALQFSDYARDLLVENVEMQATYIPITSFAITFIAIVIGIHFIAKLLDKLIDAIALSWLNTIAGVLFGILKSAFILSIILFIFEKIDTNSVIIKQDIKQKSVLFKPIQVLAPSIFPGLKDFEMEDHLPSANILPKLEA